MFRPASVINDIYHKSFRPEEKGGNTRPLSRKIGLTPSWEDEAESQRRHRLQYRQERRHEVYEINF